MALQKDIAIERYMNHGRSFSATFNALGYPDRGTLTEGGHERYPGTRKSVVGKAGLRQPHWHPIGRQCTSSAREKAVRWPWRKGAFPNIQPGVRTDNFYFVLFWDQNDKKLKGQDIAYLLKSDSLLAT